jgi:hypothetical protein
MKKYRTWYDTKIEEVEVLRETKNCVFIASNYYSKTGMKASKRSEGPCYFDTWQEAKDFLIDREKSAIIKLVDEVKRRQETLQKIMELQA